MQHMANRGADLVLDFAGGHKVTSGAQSNVADTKAVIRAFFRRGLLGAQ